MDDNNTLTDKATRVHAKEDLLEKGHKALLVLSNEIYQLQRRGDMDGNDSELYMFHKQHGMFTRLHSPPSLLFSSPKHTLP
jgi:hypothetical protein